MNKEALIIFVKNPELGKVKTRLAATIGDEKALNIYKQLLTHTNTITKEFNQDVHVFYSQHLDKNDLWDNQNFQKHVQSNGDLGQKMLNAFKTCFELDYNKVVVIGSDMMDISELIINEAFDALREDDFVIGPAVDGGYYLLGMNKLHQSIFQNKKWSSESVFADTITNITQLGLKHSKLDTLNDIDTEKDWNMYLASQSELK